MPEVIRSIAARLREYIGNSRRAPRHTAEVPVSVSPLDVKPRATGQQRLPVTRGITRDISSTGLSLVVPAIHVGGRYLTGENRVLRIRLQLPECEIELDAQPVRYERLLAEAPESGYVIGAHITGMDADDHRQFVSYLSTLR